MPSLPVLPPSCFQRSPIAPCVHSVLSLYVKSVLTGMSTSRIPCTCAVDCPSTEIVSRPFLSVIKVELPFTGSRPSASVYAW